jgi:hypothetical protein
MQLLRALYIKTFTKLRIPVNLNTDYPLSRLQGLNVWNEVRLLEEGVEDMQGLVTANTVDVMLHTHVPVHRLVDWLDQAHLQIRLEPIEPEPRNARGGVAAEQTGDGPSDGDGGGRTLREGLKDRGITRATDFLIAFGVYRPVDAERRPARWCADENASRLAQRLAHDSGWDQEDILALVDILRNDTGLTPVLNWRLWGAERLSKLLSGQVADDVCTEPQPSAQEAPDTGADAAIRPARTPDVSSSAA